MKITWYFWVIKTRWLLMKHGNYSWIELISYLHANPWFVGTVLLLKKIMYWIGSGSANPQNFWYQIGLVLKKLFRCIPNFDTILKYLTWFHYSFSTVSTDCKDITGQSHPLIKININGSLITASKKSGCQKNVVIFRIHQLNWGHF